ncbi:VPLPA-CTERM sorting domain-containing protein [Seohaeicola zhoushanensis]|uniref:VPLPA-CTERM protein sorting domain-containing protein n=1 Tax=Seohaeicola zhoushanensis TaxID=1569283 RepID=A0A8J3GTY6_9RHOB|nr:VPLPA-CTERM sorting domain-containing protein [Seohaeicola zhoushanensis]GHF37037.1 hypothetical protein GCM10017056_06160 [Seohaeicola zhoushanensis]
MKKILSTLAVAAVFGASAASAATFTVTRQDQLFGGNLLRNVEINYNGTNKAVSAGMFHLKSDDMGDFVAFCVDLAQTLGKPSQVVEKAVLFSDTVRTNVDKLFSSVIGTSTMASVINDGVLAAGFQLALWEIIYDSEGGFDLNNGTFKRGNTSNVQAWNQAQAYLNGLGDKTGLQDITYLFSEANQDLVTGTPVDNNEPAPVPVPASGLLILAGLGGLAALRRRKAV